MCKDMETANADVATGKQVCCVAGLMVQVTFYKDI